MAVSSSQRAVRVMPRRLAALAEFVARKEGVRLRAIDLAVVGRREIVALNRRWLGHDRPTDVLSFDLSDAGRPGARTGGRRADSTRASGEGLCAQIVVCGEVAAKQARRLGLPPQQELMLYVVHGLLHLMGYDDQAARAAARMHAREEELLRAFLSPSGREHQSRARIPKSEIQSDQFAGPQGRPAGSRGRKPPEKR